MGTVLPVGVTAAEGKEHTGLHTWIQKKTLLCWGTPSVYQLSLEKLFAKLS